MLLEFVEWLGDVCIKLFELGLIVGVGVAVVKGLKFVVGEAMGLLSKKEE